MNFRVFTLVSVFSVLASQATAQDWSPDITQQLASREFNDQRQAYQWAARHMMPVQEKSGGQTRALIRLEGGMPKYRATYSNLDAATSIGVGTARNTFGLSGTGITVGVWDGGTPRATHQELAGKVLKQDTEATGDHPTHVAGTIAGSGILSIARGMAPSAQIAAWGWTSDTSEMNAAAFNGLRLSNHSYGYIAGWAQMADGWYWFGQPSHAEDSSFGRYDATSQTYDFIATENPYYLIFKAAGNDRGEGPPAGTPHKAWNGTAWAQSTATRAKDGGTAGFDSIPSDSTGKNIVTVGAADDVLNYSGPSSVVMSSFSGFGPANDGRIKPDLVANGVGLTSATANSNTSYGTWSGTSMATPNLSGGAALLIQHFRNLNANQDMRAATLKALLIHTAREAGSSPGPDYRFGWGLADINAAAQHISDRAANKPFMMQELTVSNGQIIEQRYQCQSGKPLKVTIAWTDPMGAAQSWSVMNDRTRSLVNDLDVRVLRGSTQTLPWALDPLKPGTAARRADNRVDNVEQVLVSTAATAVYTIRVRAKAGTSLSPGGTQAFSMIVSNGVRLQ